jgi:hypothetical protein
MKTINALTARNNLGKIIEALNKTGKPILLSKKKQNKSGADSPRGFQEALCRCAGRG